MNNRKIGNLGENIANRYLIKNGYKILKRNHKEGFDEIDIIASDKSGILIFFEVKTIFDAFKDRAGFMPEDNFTGMKFKKTTRASQKFIAKNTWLLDEEAGWQIDLIAVKIRSATKYDLSHYKNI